MTVKIIKDIKKAEEEADKIIAQAVEEAGQIGAQTQKRSYYSMEQGRNRAEKEKEEIIKAALKEAEAEAKKIELEYVHKSTAIRDKAESGIKKAAKEAAERIVKF